MPVSSSKMYFDGSHSCTTEELYSKGVEDYRFLTWGSQGWYVNVWFRWETCPFVICCSSMTSETCLCSWIEFNTSLLPSSTGRGNVWRQWRQNCHVLFISLTFMTHDKAGLRKELCVLSHHKNVLIHIYNFTMDLSKNKCWNMLANNNGNTDFFWRIQYSILILSATYCVQRLNSSGKF